MNSRRYYLTPIVRPEIRPAVLEEYNLVQYLLGDQVLVRDVKSGEDRAFYSGHLFRTPQDAYDWHFENFRSKEAVTSLEMWAASYPDPLSPSDDQHLEIPE